MLDSPLAALGKPPGTSNRAERLVELSLDPDSHVPPLTTSMPQRGPRLLKVLPSGRSSA
jgi:hypothetical protein